MFSSVESASDVEQPAVVPTRFVWPYGGRQVYITGTFKSWAESVQMSPVEGCPNVFQTICNLTPGYHQFKFYVDGEWRHDENQPSVQGSYGIVNTVFIAPLAREPDTSNSRLSQETAGLRVNMDVDTDAFHQTLINAKGSTAVNRNFDMEKKIDKKGKVPFEGTPGNRSSGDGELLRVSEADIEVSRRRVSLFLSTHTAYELLPESGKVIALDVGVPVKQAFHILYEQGITVAPLWDTCQGQFVGVLSALDFILILRELGNHGSNLTEEELETHTISAWKEGKFNLSRQVDGSSKSFPSQLVTAGPYDSLKDVALKILQNEVSTVPIINSSSQDGSYPQLLHLASLSGILKCICRHFKHSSSALPILQQPISAIPFGTWVPKIGESNGRPLAMLRPNASLGAALNLLVQAEVSSIPIVDDKDSLLDVYSRSDITALAKDKAYTQIHLNEMSIHQALQVGQEANSPFGVFNGQRCQMCLPSDPLNKAIERLAVPGVRRLIVVEAGSKRVEGIISLSDVFRLLLG